MHGDFILSSEMMEKLRMAIRSHEAETGKPPLVVNYPIMPTSFMGIKIHFYNGNHLFTISEGKTVHHIFKDQPK